MTIDALPDIAFSRLGTSAVRDHRGAPPPFAANLTASYVPSLFLPKDRLALPVETIWHLPAVDSDLIRSLVPDLENHFERRLQLMFQQFLLVYQTGVVCSSGKTDGQMGQGNSAYAAAHNATLPTLYCKKGGEGVYIGKTSSLADTWNETVLLPKLANQLDSRLDLHQRKIGVPKALRALALDELNAVANEQTVVMPEEALRNFVEKTDLVLKSAIRNEKGEQELLILRAYETANNVYLKLLQRPSELARKLCLVSEEVQLTSRFYKDWQRGMYRDLILTERSPLLLAPQEAVARPIAQAALAGKAGVYVKSCLADATVQKCLQVYNEQIQTEVKQRDLVALGSLTNSRSAKALPFSPLFKALYDASLAHIRQKYFVMEPKNMGLILKALLIEKKE